jgi:NADH:ubiquinone oxidoreductase subunit 2 (subunit N)
MKNTLRYFLIGAVATGLTAFGAVTTKQQAKKATHTTNHVSTHSSKRAKTGAKKGANKTVVASTKAPAK